MQPDISVKWLEIVAPGDARNSRVFKKKFDIRWNIKERGLNDRNVKLRKHRRWIIKISNLCPFDLIYPAHRIICTQF